MTPTYESSLKTTGLDFIPLAVREPIGSVFSVFASGSTTVDIAMPNRDGIEATRQMIAKMPGHQDGRLINIFRDGGCNGNSEGWLIGYLPKDCYCPPIYRNA